jgi:hypothetical protein
MVARGHGRPREDDRSRGGYPSAKTYPAKGGYLIEGACNCAIELRAASLQIESADGIKLVYHLDPADARAGEMADSKSGGDLPQIPPILPQSTLIE